MNYEQALSLLESGKNVRLPEWLGYWVMDGHGAIKAVTKTGDVTDSWAALGQNSSWEAREDWEVAEGLGFGWAISALKSGKKV